MIKHFMEVFQPDSQPEANLTATAGEGGWPDG
jgi:hypothetical protein